MVVGATVDGAGRVAGGSAVEVVGGRDLLMFTSCTPKGFVVVGAAVLVAGRIADVAGAAVAGAAAVVAGEAAGQHRAYLKQASIDLQEVKGFGTHNAYSMQQELLTH